MARHWLLRYLQEDEVPPAESDWDELLAPYGDRIRIIRRLPGQILVEAERVTLYKIVTRHPALYTEPEGHPSPQD